MKSKIVYSAIVLLISFSILYSGCKSTDPVDSQFITYNYTDTITNPSSEFEILYNMSLYGDQIAYVTFEEDAVWVISKLGESRVIFAIAANDVSPHIIGSVDTVGLMGGYQYKFIANNNNYPDLYNFFTHFTKLSVDYYSFEPKF
jgi:hypothetical protein